MMGLASTSAAAAITASSSAGGLNNHAHHPHHLHHQHQHHHHHHHSHPYPHSHGHQHLANGASSSSSSSNNNNNNIHASTSNSTNNAIPNLQQNFDANPPTRSHNNWRKSTRSQQQHQHQHQSTLNSFSSTLKPSSSALPSALASSLARVAPQTLLDLSAKIVAEHIPFQLIEQRYEHIPEPVQRRIIFWSFPRCEDDIKMYSSLSSDTFNANAPLSLTSSGSTTNNSTSTSTSATSSSLSIGNTNTTQAPSFNFAAWVEQNNNTINNNNIPLATSAAPGSTSTSAPLSASLSRTSSHQKQLTFHKGLRLYNNGCVQDVLQVGFNLSGLVVIKSSLSNQATGNSRIRGTNHHSSNNSNINHNNNNNHHHVNNNIIINNNNNNNNINHALNAQNAADANNNHVSPTSNTESINSATDTLSTRSYRVSVTFDRCKITSVSCSCELQDIFWCEHVVALILYRMRNTETIDLRVPISETLSSLDRQQLQKLVQYLIAEHYTEVLPTAQRLLDEMRKSFSEINQIHGAPDPTAGASADDAHIWHLNEQQVNEKVQNYLNMVCSNSKDAIKQINALFEKIREMFRAKDSNGTRLLRLITEQFLSFATRNEKSRSLWDQLVSLWVVVMLNPDITGAERKHYVQLLLDWSKATKCPKEDVERRVVVKRKAVEMSDDEDSDEYTTNNFCSDYLRSYSQSNNIPAHLATHRHRTFQPNNGFPVLRPFNQPPSILPPACPCQIPHQLAKKIKTHHHLQNNFEPMAYQRPSTSSGRNVGLARSQNIPIQNANDNRPAPNQEPRSVFHRALDFQDSSWDDPHLQLILNKDGPIKIHNSSQSHLLDFAGNPLWHESVSQAAARIETLRSHGYREQALRLTLATVRRLKLYQDQWFISTSEPQELSSFSLETDLNSEGWIGHPFDPINVMVDLLLEASLSEAGSNLNSISPAGNMCNVSTNRCSCPYNQALADLTHRLIPDLASLSYNHRISGFPPLHLMNLTPRRPVNANQGAQNKTPYYHVPVPGCCQKDSYLTLAVETALIALGQQRSIPTITTAHDRAVRQEAELISKLEAIDTTDPLLMDILKHQTNLLLEGGPFQNSCCGIPADSAPLHTFARYLFDSLVTPYPQLAYKIGVYALKMPLLSDENNENFGAARTSPRSINLNHLQSEQLALAQTMLTKAKDESQQGGYMRRVYRASVKNIRNPASLLKLSKHVLKEAKPSGNTTYRSLLETAFDLGLQVLKLTREPHTSNGKIRRDAILFIVECSTDLGLKSVLHVMKFSREHFSAIEALNLVVSRDNEHANLRSQALSKLKLKDRPLEEAELNYRCRDLVLDCADLDPTNCALDALKFCEVDEESLKKALKIVMDAGTNSAMDSTQLIKVADHIHERGMTDKAFEIALVAVDSLSIPSNSDNTSSKKDIFSACEYAQRVNGFSTLIPKLINNIECATVLSEIYHRFGPSTLLAPNYRGYGADVMASYRGNLNFNREYNEILNSFNSDLYKQKIEDAGWWDALLKRTLKSFVDTTRTRLLNISPRHYGEFIDFLVKAQGTFEKATYGPQQFKDLISEIMKSYRTKKKLMERLKTRFDYSIKAGS